ncbi:unnamed protein product [Rhizoctonia solani]|uniref:C2H2-type domain-containing protein n=1 Tax=Rhizoctonia solani TaxID=456999 RepID=A0A8H3HW99_9AGAM|nr:unnamed protein product [Rhizoctonia solani]
MSTPFALDPALAANSTSSTEAAPPTTASPSSLTRTPVKEAVRPNPTHNPNPAYYSILPALPPLPGWGPFPGPMFAPPAPMPAPVPMYMVPGPWHHDMNQPPPPMAVDPPPQSELPMPTSPNPVPTPALVTTTAAVQTQLQPQATSLAQPQTSHQNQHQHQPQQTEAQVQPQPQPKPHYPSERAKSSSAFSQVGQLPATQPGVKPRSRLLEPPPINPAATTSPHYQNPGGFGGVYTPPSQAPADPSPTLSHSHYAHKSLDAPSSSSGDLGRPFACGAAGCSAAFDRKSDCERHRRTHTKGAAETRPFKCSRAGCEAAFDRKDALMRHERNERTHLVRQTQPGRIKRPTRAPSKLDHNTMSSSPPRRMSTRKRKTVTPGVYLDPSESDFEEDDGEYAEGSKRVRAGESEDDNHGGGMVMEGRAHDGLRGQSNITLSAHPSTLENHSTPNNPGLSSTSIGGGMEDMVVIPPDEQLVIDPQLRTDASFVSSLRADGFGDAQGTFTGSDEDFATVEVGAETLQAVEAIQAALQQMEADKSHEAMVV